MIKTRYRIMLFLVVLLFCFSCLGCTSWDDRSIYYEEEEVGDIRVKDKEIDIYRTKEDVDAVDRDGCIDNFGSDVGEDMGIKSCYPFWKANKVAAGGGFTCALIDNGGVKCWGINEDGELGIGVTNEESVFTPKLVWGLSRGVVDISAGWSHACAILSTGGVKCWGDNRYGQLGDGSTLDKPIPVDVINLSLEVVSISAGGAHTCALLSSGGVKCWGYNRYGQLGDGTTEDRNTPVDVVGLAGDVVMISAGGSHTCAILSDGRVKCWGENMYGQLGDGTKENRFTPVDVLDLPRDVVYISAGEEHTCIVLSNGWVKCWGDDGRGQLGNGRKSYYSLVPVDVEKLSRGVKLISAGGDHTCALLSDGGVKCWGYNKYGQLGDGTREDKYVPVDVKGLSTEVIDISTRGTHTCVVLSSGGIKCWGNNMYGQLGIREFTRTHSSVPEDVKGIYVGVKAITAGGSHTCILTCQGGVKCWGDNESGQLGDGGKNYYSPIPMDVEGLSSGVKGISAGGAHTCALLSTGGVKCWGDNRYGQLGDGTYENRFTPVDVVGLSSDVVLVEAGTYHTCAFTSNGLIKCWGNNQRDQLGVSKSFTFC